MSPCASAYVCMCVRLFATLYILAQLYTKCFHNHVYRCVDSYTNRWYLMISIGISSILMVIKNKLRIAQVHTYMVVNKLAIQSVAVLP